jgi:hypothetical protein
MKIAITYWISTGLLAVLYFAAATFYLLQHDTVVAELGALGYPAYLATLLPFVKILGPLAILVRKWIALSDLAYAGMFYHLLLAASAHMNAGDGGYTPALVGLGLLIISFFTQNAVRKGRSPYAGDRFGIASP